jgi:hypothetical protein
MTFCSKVRKLLQANETVLPDRIIESPLISEAAENVMKQDKATGEGLKALATAALCCPGLTSRTKVPPFIEYKENWAKKAEKLWAQYHRLVKNPA